jgi:hypothetical protein
MNEASNRPRSRTLLWAGLWALIFGGGCQTVHTVTVDAINNAHKSAGQSYRLEVLDPSGGVEAGLQAQATATIKDALAARGLYEVPEGTKPDMIITYTYGVGHGHIKVVTERNTDLLIGPTVAPETTSKAVVVFDKFIELTAREAIFTPDPTHPGGPARPGDELWNIKATIEDAKKDLDPYLPALASACIDYIGANTGKELQLKVDADAAKVILKQRGQPPGQPPAPVAVK